MSGSPCPRHDTAAPPDDGADNEEEDAFRGDPEELRKLQEESGMEIDKVLERLRKETEDNGDRMDEGNGSADDAAAPPTKRKRVTFAQGEINPSPDAAKLPSRRAQRRGGPGPDTGCDADDDGDASDVEDFEDTGHTSDGSDEFKADPTEQDDETTIAAEERLGREMSVEDEISMLQREGEMSIEELRKLYSIGAPGAATAPVKQESDVEASDGASDVSDGSDEFREDPLEQDDETTIAAEERLAFHW